MFLIRGLIGLIFTIIVAVFAALNRTAVPVTWNPIEIDGAIELPLYFIILGCLAFGFIIGGLSVWLNSANVRRDRRKQKREIKILEKELDRLKEDNSSDTKPPAQDMFVALSSQ